MRGYTRIIVSWGRLNAHASPLICAGLNVVGIGRLDWVLGVGFDMRISMKVGLVEADVVSGRSDSVVGRVEGLVDEVVVLSSDFSVGNFSDKRSWSSVSCNWLAAGSSVFFTSRARKCASEGTILF
jgi:hypothetical protein